MLNYLEKLRQHRHQAQTLGLSDVVIRKFLAVDKQLGRAIVMAYEYSQSEAWQEFVHHAPPSEAEQVRYTQTRMFNFYADEALNPYIPLGAAGPWIVTSFGAVLHDSGGYGMLGFGHCVGKTQEILGANHVMANVMTASPSHHRICAALDAEIGHTRTTQTHVYGRYMFLNSGSEALSLAARIADVNTKNRITPQHKQVRSLSMAHSFHGRTERPARLSDSCRPAYRQHLHSFTELDDVGTLKHNDVQGLRQAFTAAERDGVFIDAVYLEPISGEGDTGCPLSPEFYSLARELTATSGALLVIDSVQAGIRGHGVLSVVDYPEFRELPQPDIEAFSKAIHMGHTPLSVIALSAKTAAFFKHGVHGNTMTANPRALEVGRHTLSMLTPELRRNIVVRGEEFLQQLGKLRNEFPHLINRAQGTGLLLCIDINPDIAVVGADGLEMRLRKQGLGVIHAGKNLLRFTPVFNITSEEISLIISVLRSMLSKI